MVGQQPVSVVVEVADQRDIDAHALKMIANTGNRRCCLWCVDRNTHKFRPGTRQFSALDRGLDDIGGIGVGHRLNDDWRTATNDDPPDAHRLGWVTYNKGIHAHSTVRRATSSLLRDDRLMGLPLYCKVT